MEANDSKDFYFDKDNNNYCISLNFINKNRIIINDDICSKNFFALIKDKLNKDGFNILFTSNSNFELRENDIVITLDQQYISGPYISIFCPFDNNRRDSSDALAIAMSNSFLNNNINNNGVFSGKKGYQKNNNGTIDSRVPTNTENKINNSLNINFVTISFGTNSIPTDIIAKGIEDGISKFLIYSSKNIDMDLIYRVENFENLEFIANKFNTTKKELQEFNNIKSKFIKDITILNPSYLDSNVLNKNISIKYIK